MVSILPKLRSLLKENVIPVEIREKLGIREGEEVEWVLEGEVILVKPVREEKKS